jgi:indole-3-glycerol phosphate synthase
VQASKAWTPPGGTLGQILDSTRERLASLDRASGATQGTRPTGLTVETSGLGRSLRRATVGVIAEIKRRSPSKGVLNEAIDATAQARAFEAGGAAAISVLTEPTYFGGSLDDIRDVAAAVALPLLKKDFHIDPRQLAEAREVGATAVLLIARALAPDDLKALVSVAEKLKLEPIVEIRSERELEIALEANARIIGVNSRDLETLEVDERVPRRLMPLIPADVIGIWESGVRTKDDVRRAADCGADAVLVGSALSKARDPEALVRALTSIPRSGR